MNLDFAQFLPVGFPLFGNAVLELPDLSPQLLDGPQQFLDILLVLLLQLSDFEIVAFVYCYILDVLHWLDALLLGWVVEVVPVRVLVLHLHLLLEQVQVVPDRLHVAVGVGSAVWWTGFQLAIWAGLLLHCPEHLLQFFDARFRVYWQQTQPRLGVVQPLLDAVGVLLDDDHIGAAEPLRTEQGGIRERVTRPMWSIGAPIHSR